ncbi:MAG TPA: restriction endonuclease [Thermoanaerobaculia bacterium]|nr:restriction endonuclease [Thermoanaerobaculia bacterium]
MKDTMSDRDEEYEGLLPWEADARNSIRGLLYNATLDREQGSVTLYSEDWGFKGEKAPRTFWDFDDLRDALIKIGDEAMNGSVPWEGGAVFDTDSEDLVDAALEAAEVQLVFLQDSESPPPEDLLYYSDDFQTSCIILAPDFAQINAELLEYFASHPEALYDLSWRQFEKLLETIFNNHGYRTQLGPGSDDEGIDLRLLSKDSIGEVVTLVQAKRYAPTRPISLEAVSALYGVVESEKANRGLFVTTSRYLPSAQRFAQKTHSRLILATPNDVARWCSLKGKREFQGAPNPGAAPDGWRRR